MYFFADGHSSTGKKHHNYRCDINIVRIIHARIKTNKHLPNVSSPLFAMPKITELYTNLSNTSKYRYPREYATDIAYDQKELTLDGLTFTNIIITGIPDGVSPIANEALIERNTPRRLYIFSETPLTDQYLNMLDKFYGKVAYKIFTCDMPNTTLVSYPRNNFYLTNGQPSSISEFVEYRYLTQRHLLTNIAYDISTNFLYKLVLPEKPLLVIIMPKNFIRTGLKSGYFRFDNNIIVRVYSKYILSSELTEDDTHEVTSFSTDNLKLVSIIEKFFGRLGMHKIVSNSNDQLYGYDKFMTMVVGNVANVVLP
nr:GrBNV gp35-like protein [Oryctes rhinoceros nudivirus]